MPQTASPASTTNHDEEELIRQALPIVQRMAQRTYHRLGRRIDIDELVSIGLSVLLQAVRRYDPKQARFPAYLVQRLKWSVAGEVRKRTRRLNLDHGLPSGVAGRYSELRLARSAASTAAMGRASSRCSSATISTAAARGHLQI